jgi:hypothetical protein
MRFGLFWQGDNEPIEVHEGDFIQMTQPPIIQVIREGGYNDTPTAVAFIHLSPGQVVREIRETPPSPVRDRRVPTAWQ